jgi:hypothetical protein
MEQNTAPEDDLEELFRQHRSYIEDLQRKWLVGKRSRSRDVYEVMSPADREEVHQTIRAWGRYIEPIAEAWWRERGYGVIWPEDNTKPMQVYKLEQPADV